jgi:hypothetical protein
MSSNVFHIQNSEQLSAFVCVSKQASKYLGKEIVNHGLLCFRIPNVLLFLEQGESENPNFGTQKQTNIPILGFATIFFSVLLLYGTSQTPCLNSGSREIPSPHAPLHPSQSCSRQTTKQKYNKIIVCLCVIGARVLESRVHVWLSF